MYVCYILLLTFPYTRLIRILFVVEKKPTSKKGKLPSSKVEPNLSCAAPSLANFRFDQAAILKCFDFGCAISSFNNPAVVLNNFFF